MDSARVRRILRQHLRTDQLLGVDAVPRGQVAVVEAVSAGDVRMMPHSQSGPSPERMSGQVRTYVEKASGELRRGYVKPSIPSHRELSPSARPISEPPPMPMPQLDRDEKIRRLAAMDHDEVSNCTKCGLCHSRTQTVFGAGDVDAAIMFIGEGPGQSEDEQGVPFVGRSGELLTKMIGAMGYDRSRVYIANVVKCRPPNNRTPTIEEVSACADYLRRQIATIAPRVIVTLGGPAAKLLLDTREGITRIRGTWHEYRGVTPTVPVMPTFHPAYLLRSYTTENRAKVWSDLQAAMKRIEEDQ